MPYEHGTCNKLLKYKPPHLNSIDFKMVVQDLPALKEGDAPGAVAQLMVSGQGDTLTPFQSTGTAASEIRVCSDRTMLGIQEGDVKGWGGGGRRHITRMPNLLICVRTHHLSNMRRTRSRG